MSNTYYLISGFKEHSFAWSFPSSEDLNWHSVRRVSGLIREASTRQDLTNQWAANGLSVRKQGLGQVRVAWGMPSFLRRMAQNRSDTSPSNRSNYRKWWGPGCRTGCKMVGGIYGELLNHLNFPMVEFPFACSSLAASLPLPSSWSSIKTEITWNFLQNSAQTSYIYSSKTGDL